MPFPLSIERLEDAEAQIGIGFPSEYRESILVENGGERTVGEVSWQLYPIQDTSDRRRLARTANHVQLETLEARKWSGFPPRGIAIGCDGCGNQLVLLPSEHEPGVLSEVIFAWDHETQELKSVAKTFGDLK